MAVYNGEKYIEEAIESILSQTYQEIELIICDDGSTDGTKEILSAYRPNPIVKCIFAEHRGKVAAFNTALAAATGDAITLVACDDVLAPESIEKRVQQLVTGKEAVYHNGYICDEELNIIGEMNVNPSTFSWDLHWLPMVRNNLLSGSLMLFSKSVADKIFPIPEELRFEDWWINFFVLLYATKIEYIDDYLFYYRQHGANACGALQGSSSNTILMNDWKRHPQFYSTLYSAVKALHHSIPQNREVLDAIENNHELVARTILRKFTFPNPNILKCAGIRKYILSQLMVLHLSGFACDSYYYVQKTKKQWRKILGGM